jgi:hypothetical protein
VLPHPAAEVPRDAHVKPLRAVGENVNVIVSAVSAHTVQVMPAKCIDPSLRRPKSRKQSIPVRRLTQDDIV